MGFLEICCIFLLIFNFQLVRSCGSDEYNFQDQCCSMCWPGTCVSKHCTPTANTVCIPCTRGTYMDRPNGLEKCLTCKYCDSELGLKTVRECSVTQDAVCGCKEGYFCLAKTRDTCHMCTKYITVFNSSISDKDTGNPKQHDVKPTAQSVLSQANVQFMDHEDTQNQLQPGKKTQRRKAVPKPETSEKLCKWESAPETTTRQSKVTRGQDPVSMRKTLMTLKQIFDANFPKESLKLQEAGNKAITELQNNMQTNLAALQNVMQFGLTDMQNKIESGLSNLQSSVKTGLADIKGALQIGMAGIQEALVSGMTDIKGIKIGLAQADNTLKQMQANSQANLLLMTKQVGSLVNILTKLASSNQTISFIQFRDITCDLSNKAESIQPKTRSQRRSGAIIIRLNGDMQLCATCIKLLSDDVS